MATLNCADLQYQPVSIYSPPLTSVKSLSKSLSTEIKLMLGFRCLDFARHILDRPIGLPQHLKFKFRPMLLPDQCLVPAARKRQSPTGPKGRLWHRTGKSGSAAAPRPHRTAGSTDGQKGHRLRHGDYPLSYVPVSSKRVADQLVCFGDNNFEWQRHRC